MIEGDEFVFIIIVCIIIVAIIVAALLISKKVNIRKYDGEGDDINDFIGEFNELRVKKPDELIQNVINNVLAINNPLKNLRLIALQNRYSLHIQLHHNTKLTFKINNTNIKCDVTVIYYDNELKFNCKYNILGVEFEENISLVDILDVLIQINKYLKDYFRILNKQLTKLDYLELERYYEKINNIDTVKITKKTNMMYISCVHDENDIKFKFNYSDKEIFVPVNNNTTILDTIKIMFYSRLLELKKIYNDNSKRKQLYTVKISNEQLILTNRQNYKFIIFENPNGELCYIENMPFISIQQSPVNSVTEADLYNKVIGFFENPPPDQLQIICKKIDAYTYIKYKFKLFWLILTSTNNRNFKFEIELIYVDGLLKYHYIENVPYTVYSNCVSGYTLISEIDILILCIITFFKPPHKIHDISDDGNPNTLIQLPGIKRIPNTPRHTIYYYNSTTGLFRYPNFINIKDNNVSINLLWISKTLEIDNAFIGGYISRESNTFEYIIPEQIIKWMVLNSYATVNLWYDSKMCTHKQIKHTYDYIKDFYRNIYFNCGIRVGNFYMKDIQTLKIVKQYPFISSTEWPIYSRVNLLRLIAAYETQINNFKQNIQSAFVYADYTVNPHSIRDVYPAGISDDGFIGLGCDLGGYENTYMIFGSWNAYMLYTLEDLILSILCRIYAEQTVIAPLYFYNEHKKFASGNNDDPEPFLLGESFLYELFVPVMCISYIRKHINPHKLKYFDCKKTNEDPENILLWNVFTGFLTTEQLTIENNNKLYNLNQLNIEESKDLFAYMCVVRDPRVSITRSSGHGDTGCLKKLAISLIDTIKNPNSGILIYSPNIYKKYMELITSLRI